MCVSKTYLPYLLRFWSAKLAFPDGTGTGKLSCWTLILTQWPNRIKLVFERLSTFIKSASNITHSAIASQERSTCVLHTVHHALTAYSLVPHQCSVLCFACCYATLHHLHISYYYSSNATASRALERQYRNASAGMNLRVMGIVETLLDLAHYMTVLPWDCTVM